MFGAHGILISFQMKLALVNGTSSAPLPTRSNASASVTSVDTEVSQY